MSATHAYNHAAKPRRRDVRYDSSARHQRPGERSSRSKRSSEQSSRNQRAEDTTGVTKPPRRKRLSRHSIVGSYKLLEPLAKGGMARLYLGRHCEHGHLAAIKILLEEQSRDKNARQRFRNEASAIASIQHPNVVGLYEFGETEEGEAYLAMEYVEGGDLAKQLKRRGALPIREALHITAQIASALARVHSAGIIHRDLKPSNIMLVARRAGSRVNAKLLDFGIAKFLDSSGSITRNGAIVGTPRFMSPEQCRGSDYLDQRSDVYSLGLILYRMVTGRYAFDGNGVVELVDKQLHCNPRSPRRYRSTISPALESLILRCLAKHPGDRYPSMNELVTALWREIARESDRAERQRGKPPRDPYGTEDSVDSLEVTTPWRIKLATEARQGGADVTALTAVLGGLHAEMESHEELSSADTHLDFPAQSDLEQQQAPPAIHESESASKQALALQAASLPEPSRSRWRFVLLFIMALVLGFTVTTLLHVNPSLLDHLPQW